MNLINVKEQLTPNIDYKGVGTLVPPMLAIARTNHTSMARELGLVEVEFSFPEPKFIPKDTTNFRVCTFQIQNGEFVLTDKSSKFPEYSPSNEEFATMLQGKISILNS